MTDFSPPDLAFSLGLSLAELVGTAVLHSSILLAGAWLASRRLESRPGLEELVWRMALVGSVLTTVLASWAPLPSVLDSSRIAFDVTGDIQRAGGVEPPAAGGRPAASPHERSSLEGVPRSAPASDARSAGPETVPQSTEVRGSRPGPGASGTATSSGSSVWVEGGRARLHGRRVWLPAPGAWPLLVGYAWLTGVLLLLAREVRDWLALRRVFRDRVAASGEEGAVLERLRLKSAIRFPVRLTVSRRVPAPVALPGREICVPPRFFQQLDPGQQRAALAHELAHVVRRDPAWGICARVVRLMLLVQVLARVAERRLATLAEINSDDWAADRSDAGSLASSLSVIAEWLVSTPSGARIAITGLAGDSRGLPYRVSRLLDRSRSSTATPAGGVIAIFVTGILILGLVLPSLTLDVRADGDGSDRGAGSGFAVTGDVGSSEPGVGPHIRTVTSSSASLADRWVLAGEVARALGHAEVTVRYSIPVRADDARGPTPSTGLVLRARARQTSDGGLEALRLTVLSAGPEVSANASGPVLDVGPVHPDSSARWIRDRVAALSLSGEAPELQRQLVEVIGAHPGQIAEAYLIRLAWIHPLREIRRRAVELLAGRPTDRVLRELGLIAERHPEPDLAREARLAIAVQEARRS